MPFKFSRKGPRLRDRQRSYKVQMFAFNEEVATMASVSPLSPDEIRRRRREIWENCFGDLRQKETHDA